MSDEEKVNRIDDAINRLERKHKIKFIEYKWRYFKWKNK